MTHEAAVDYLDAEDLIEIAAGILGDAPLRDLGLLASAAARPQTTVFGSDAYPQFMDKAAALLHSLARNHPLVDGNKVGLGRDANLLPAQRPRPGLPR